MDDQLLLSVYHWLFDPANFQHAPNCVYSDSLIVLIYQLGVIRQRSARWASNRKNLPLWMRRLQTPSYSQLMRRIGTPGVRRLIARMNCAFADALPHSDQKLCDGKPLTVGGFSKDPDAGEGKLPGEGWGRGYKLHLIADAASGVIELFTITKLGDGEPTALRRMLARAQYDLKDTLLRGDSNYDSNSLYEQVADCGGRLLANRKKPFTGLGHHKHHPDRLRAIAELEESPKAMAEHRRRRAGIERTLGHLTNLPFGLCPLPNFVRRQNRVSLWVLSKVMLYHLHLCTRQKRIISQRSAA